MITCHVYKCRVIYIHDILSFRDRRISQYTHTTTTTSSLSLSSQTTNIISSYRYISKYNKSNHEHTQLVSHHSGASTAASASLSLSVNVYCMPYILLSSSDNIEDVDSVEDSFLQE